MAHLQHLEDSTFLELMNTPFSPVHFSTEEMTMLREMEFSVLSEKPLFSPADH